MASGTVQERVEAFGALARGYAALQTLPSWSLPADAPQTSESAWLAWTRKGGLCAIVSDALRDTDIELKGNVETLQSRVLTHLAASPSRPGLVGAIMLLVDDMSTIVKELRKAKEPPVCALTCATATLPLR